ncbi:alpha/beta hydrolase [Flavobacterium sp. N1718]|nr:alpha/beta hydrolase-fold protein [Flavobacterium sp. N1718]
MKYLIALLISCCGLAQDLPQVVSGRIERIENFPSKYVTSRTIDVWLPEGYSTAKHYDVLYMHDGQMLFDPTKSWNKQAWDVDDVASALMAKGTVRPFIVVGVWNGGVTRHPDYFPQKPFESLTPVARDTVTAQLRKAGRTEAAFQPQSDNYLKFLVTEVKPYIDQTYSVNPDQAHTFIAGSSMGGLISMYALCEYPDVFGGAACLSTHWPGTFAAENNPMPDAFISYLSSHLPDPKTHRLYFDCGDQTLDAMYPPIQKKVDALLARKGYTGGKGLSRFFPGDDHSEKAWKARLDVPLVFLLGRP